MTTHTIDDLLVGRGDRIVLQSFDILRQTLEAHLHVRSPRLAFMTEAHHRVRDFVVTELPLQGKPLPSEHIATGTGISLPRTEAILDDLERERFFLVRNANREVSWAFPVTSEPTPHCLRLSTGETIHAA